MKVAGDAAAGYLAERDRSKWLTMGMDPEEAARICSGTLKTLGKVGPDHYRTIAGAVQADFDTLERLWLYGYVLAQAQEAYARLVEDS